MYDEPEALRERINHLSNEELLQMVNIDHEQYREDALDQARAEMRRRGLKIEQVSPEDSLREDENADVSAAPDAEGLGSDEEVEPEEGHTPSVEFRTYRGVLASWDELCSEAAAFATEIGPLNLISISHSEDENEGVVTVWYWA
jgi:hypothetical protein